MQVVVDPLVGICYDQLLIHQGQKSILIGKTVWYMGMQNRKTHKTKQNKTRKQNQTKQDKPVVELLC